MGKKFTKKEYEEAAKKRFDESYEVINGCWVWQRRLTVKGGYAYMSVANKDCRAHRYSYERFVGKIPKGMLVCHKCDNPACVNPKHLWIGTAQDNTDDMIKKGRQKFKVGETAWACKLTEKQVLEIYKSNKSHADLGRQYNINITSVMRIRNGKTWKSVTNGQKQGRKPLTVKEKIMIFLDDKDYQAFSPLEMATAFGFKNSCLLTDPLRILMRDGAIYRKQTGLSKRTAVYGKKQP